MIKHIVATNVNEAYVEGWWALKTHGVEEQSRNGPVMVMPGPVITEYLRPWERVLLDPDRDCNHTFHLMEALWMLSGSSDLSHIAHFNPRMLSYTDGLSTHQHGAYGWRWREAFGQDQILLAISELRKNPESRRVVLGMWHPTMDQTHTGPDVPCNTHIYFDRRGGALNMTVCNRSNDMLWGAYGANAVHMSMLQELMALELGIPIGRYYQFSNNFHVYLDVPGVRNKLLYPPPKFGGFYPEQVWLLERGESIDMFLRDCERFFRGENTQCAFFTKVAHPMKTAYEFRKAGNPWNLDQMANCDWKWAFQQWIDRRDSKEA